MSKYLTSPAGKALFINAFEPDKKFDVYGGKLIVPREKAQPLIDQIDEWVAESLKTAIKEKITKKKASVPYTEVTDDEGNPTGDIQFSFKQKARKKDGTPLNIKIGVFDGKGTPITKPIAIGNGSLIKIAFEPHQWANASQGASVQLRIKAVQILKLVEFRGAASADAYGFGEEEEGYEFKESNAKESSGEDEESFAEAEDEDGDF